MDLRAKLIAGYEAIAQERAEKDKSRPPSYRVGTSGCVTADGKVYGTCHRKALARYLGIEEAPELHTRLMWNAGEVNEQAWAKAMGRPNGEIAVEGEVDGITVTGHPDVVYTDDAGTPTFGVELKGVYSEGTAVTVELEGKPKPENMIQAALYSLMLGKLPYALVYTSANYISVPYYEQKKHDGIKKLKPFYKIFYLEWRGDELWYRDEHHTGGVQTVITAEGLRDYYRLVDEMRRTGELGPRPTADYVCGTKAKWGPDSACKFCPFKSACDRYDESNMYSEWVADARLAVGG